MRLKDQVAVITGGAAGIGKACAKRFAEEGAKVVLADVNVARGEEAVEEIQASGGEALFVSCDVGSKAEVDSLIAATVAGYGRIDCAIANAGIVHAASFLDLDEADFDRVLRVNLKGVFLTGQAAARQMVKQGGGGTIINMSSVNAVMAIPAITPYVVSKGGVMQLTKVMALSLTEHDIRVNAIGPGSIRTEVFEQVANDPEKIRGILSRTPMGRVGEPEEIASVALFLASKDSSYITGQTIYPDGGRMALNYTVPVKA
ncbi:SDR family NAD(P)-dependent oxidoreductase [Limibacillus halophilus]|uniref:NAD(P)-dependent dehydrogenase (Short-subunit alcohol dehydrogenase family) n=1 Tax=Limibacillus halophilus TaxID=1579333 RepID=A0A839SWH3_9PROT|nr:SDR family NAD(P)-dependent oxidoreductase [Limibacillus halophilus]MBB3066842.1 NAD(P)-dependent dehydrogenase (short-subunit alcohol dehydrogenase family) [Limibacillus halophilus]